MGTLTKDQITAVAKQYEERVPIRARELEAAGAPLDPNRIKGMWPTFGDYLDEAARQIIGGRFDYHIQETVNCEFVFYIGLYNGEPADGR